MLEEKGKHEDVDYSHHFLRMNIKDFLNSLHDIKYAKYEAEHHDFQTVSDKFLFILTLSSLKFHSRLSLTFQCLDVSKCCRNIFPCSSAK